MRLFILGVVGSVLSRGLLWPAAADPPFAISLHSIQFNHDTSNQTADGVTLQRNDVDKTAPEWITSSGKNDTIGYVLGYSKTLKVKFTCTSDTVTQLLIWATKTGGNLLSDLGPKTITFSQGVSNPEYQGFDIAQGDIPSVVRKGSVSWEWKFQQGGQSWTMGTTGPHRIYVLYSIPLSPESAPEVGILEYACAWADGQNTADGIASALLSNGFAAYYNYGPQYYYCHRLASDFCRLMRALGASAAQRLWGQKDGLELTDMVDLKTIWINPVGDGTSDAGVYVFAKHQWCEAATAQRDPTTATSYSGNWGAYEDYLFAQYDSCIVASNPPVSGPYRNNVSGQPEGTCEDYTGQDKKCVFDNDPAIQDWLGPNVP